MPHQLTDEQLLNGEGNGFGLDLPATAADIDKLQNQLTADRAQQQRRFDELECEMRTFDTHALGAYREWSERQVSLFQLYVDELADRLDELDTLEGRPDPRSAAVDLTPIHDRLDGAIGEAMTVRIELDRLAEQVQQRFDDFSVRLAAVESRLAERSGGGSSVAQSERLDEIERALEYLASESRPHLGTTGEPAPTRDPGGPSHSCDAGPDPLTRLAFTLADADRAGSTDNASTLGAAPPPPQTQRTQPERARPSVPQPVPPGPVGEAGG